MDQNLRRRSDRPVHAPCFATEGPDDAHHPRSRRFGGSPIGATTVAAAELARLTTADASAWQNASFEGDPVAALQDVNPAAAELAALRDRAVTCIPLELLEAVTNVAPPLSCIRGGGRVEERLVNLEALRDAAAAHQDAQRAAYRAVTLAGPCAGLVRRNPDRPRTTDPDAVQVRSYHGAKGLEWPMADRGADRPGCGREGSCLRSARRVGWRARRGDPPAGRWLRYWTWPYGVQKKGAVLDGMAAASPAGRAGAERERLKRIRFLYVGVTRANDHLVLPTRGHGAQAWLDELGDEGGTPTVRFEDGQPIAGSRTFPLKPAIDLEARSEPSRTPRLECARGPVAWVPYPPKCITPSASPADAVPRLLEARFLGDRIALSGRADMRAVAEPRLLLDRGWRVSSSAFRSRVMVDRPHQLPRSTPRWVRFPRHHR